MQFNGLSNVIGAEYTHMQADKRTKHVEVSMKEAEARVIKAEERVRKANIELAQNDPVSKVGDVELKTLRERVLIALSLM